MKIGPLVISDDKMDELSPETKSLIESEVKELLGGSQNRAKDVLLAHRKELEVVARALLEYEILSKEEIIALIAGKKIRK